MEAAAKGASSRVGSLVGAVASPGVALIPATPCGRLCGRSCEGVQTGFGIRATAFLVCRAIVRLGPIPTPSLSGLEHTLFWFGRFAGDALQRILGAGERVGCPKRQANFGMPAFVELIAPHGKSADQHAQYGWHEVAGLQPPDRVGRVVRAFRRVEAEERQNGVSDADRNRRTDLARARDQGIEQRGLVLTGLQANFI